MADASIRVDVVRADRLGVRFAEFPEDLRAELRKEIEKLIKELEARVIAAAPRKTGKLQSEIRTRLFDDAESIKGFLDIGTDTVSELLKAITLEFGSSGKPVAVPPRRNTHGTWLGRFFAPKITLEQKFRTPNIAARRYERNPLAAMQPEIAARLNAAVEAAIAKVNA